MKKTNLDNTPHCDSPQRDNYHLGAKTFCNPKVKFERTYIYIIRYGWRKDWFCFFSIVIYYFWTVHD